MAKHNRVRTDVVRAIAPPTYDEAWSRIAEDGTDVFGAESTSVWLQHKGASQCNFCGELILWRYTPAGKLMPLDPDVLDVPETGSYTILDTHNCAPYEPLFDAPDMLYHKNHWSWCTRQK